MSASTSPTSPHLELLNAAGQVVSRVPIEKTVVTIGRSDTCGLVLRDPIEIGRAHV